MTDKTLFEIAHEADDLAVQLHQAKREIERLNGVLESERHARRHVKSIIVKDLEEEVARLKFERDLARRAVDDLKAENKRLEDRISNLGWTLELYR